MGWKDWPLWKKCGLITCLIGAISLLTPLLTKCRYTLGFLGGPSGFSGCNSFTEFLTGIALILILVPAGILMSIFGSNSEIILILIPILSLSVMFGIGAIIGLIISKIKSRKSSSEEMI